MGALTSIMDDSATPELDELVALAEQAERILASSSGSHDIRHACALGRGYLDLVRHYHEPLKVEDLERVIARMRTLLGLNTPNHELELYASDADAQRT
jgi:hypothetical protein